MSPQQTIAHYRIAAKLGQGGMGEVYRATDTKLNREVAIKILPEAFAQDADRMARFTREAQILAALNHPNIAAIYGVEERALVMELVEGPTLADRIAQGPIPLEEALPIARQIAEALEAAHEKSIVHRDLKPGNVKIRPDGTVKVLDFGLAKALAADSQPEASATCLPTLSMRRTQLGVIIGTAAYMSPEQAKGKPVDRRGDIWAFGVVLYEMLTGRQLYTCETVSETLASVIKDTPDLAALPETTTPEIRRLLRRCLEKEPRRRLQAIGEARFLLEEPAEEVAPAAAAVAVAPPRRAMLPWVIAGAFALATLVASWIAWRAARPSDRPVMRFIAELGPDAVAIAGTHSTIAISPDGRRLVFAVRGANGTTQLATRLMDQYRATVLPGSEEGRDPFFKPDSQWIGFFAGDKLKKISVQGGAAIKLCENPAPAGDRGGSWGEDGTIIAALDAFHLFRVPEAGGKPQMLPVKVDQGAISYRWPQILPGGEAVLATTGILGGFEDADIAVVSLKTGEVRKVLSGGYFGRYLPSGHLIHIHQGTLFAVPFDPRRMETRGTPAPVQEEVAGNLTNGSGNLDFSGAPSSPGTLVYLSGQSASGGGVTVWLDATGNKVPVVASGVAFTPRLSPDGKNLALSIAGDIFNYDVQRGAMNRITFTAAGNRWPVWTPDGKYIVYSPAAGGIWWTRADASGQPDRLLETKGATAPQSFSPDGRRLAYCHVGEGILIVPLDATNPDHPKPGIPESFLRMPGAFSHAAFSPDGRWLAYSSAESGAYQVYVRPYRADGAPSVSAGKWQVSTAPARFPIWSRNRKELFYERMDGHIVVAGYAAKGGTFTPGRPRQWTETPIQLTGSYQNLDLAPDGKRFVVFSTPDTGGDRGPARVTFLVNFFDELKRRMP